MALITITRRGKIDAPTGVVAPSVRGQFTLRLRRSEPTWNRILRTNEREQRVSAATAAHGLPLTGRLVVRCALGLLVRRPSTDSASYALSVSVPTVSFPRAERSYVQIARPSKVNGGEFLREIAPRMGCVYAVNDHSSKGSHGVNHVATITSVDQCRRGIGALLRGVVINADSRAAAVSLARIACTKCASRMISSAERLFSSMAVVVRVAVRRACISYQSTTFSTTARSSAGKPEAKGTLSIGGCLEKPVRRVIRFFALTAISLRGTFGRVRTHGTIPMFAR